jgi:hypothetical protein
MGLLAAAVPAVDRTPVLDGIGDGSADGVNGESWRRAEWLLAALVPVVIALRIAVIPQIQVTAGALLAFALIPVWWPAAVRFAGARLLLLLAVLAAISGAFLTLMAARDHQVSLISTLAGGAQLLGAAACLGLLLWARTKIGTAWLGVLFGVGLLLGFSSSGDLYAANPWRFGFSVPVTVLVLALCDAGRRRGLALVAVLALAAVSALTDARSSFALLLLTAAVLAWQLRPLQNTRGGSASRRLLGLGLLAAAAYNVGQAAILNGFLGVRTQQRTLQQVTETGSLILGGRPELTATLALMRDRFYGFGTGTFPNFHDISVAKAGMAAINYDPNNGYVDNWMFGHGIALHSVIGDLWAQAGILGLCFTALVLAVTVYAVLSRMASNVASALLVYVCLKTSWNLFFGPWYSSLLILVLALALGMVERKVSSGPAVPVPG